MIKNRDIHKTKNGNLIILFSILLLTALSSLVFAIPDSLTLQGKLTNLAGTSQVGTFNFSFRIYDSYTAGNKLYESNINLTTDANGIYDVVLQNLSSLNFSDQYYLGITVSTDDESQPRINLTSTPYSFRANISEGLNKESKYEIKELNITGNLTLGDGFDDVLSVTTGRLNISDGNIISGGNLTLADRVTFRFNQIIDNLVSGFLRISGSLNVTGNVTIAQNTLFVDNTSGRVGIGTINPINILTVAGDVSAFGSLNATFINASGIKVGTNDVQTVNAVFNLVNYSAAYAATGFDRENVSEYSGGADVNASLIKIANISKLFEENYSKEYASTGFKIANGTALPFSNFQLSNVSNNTLVKGDNATLALWTVEGSNIARASGSVGIGTTTPDNLLTVLGNEITANAILHLNASDSYNKSVVNVLTLDHVLKNPVNSTGGIGVSILFRASDNASQTYKIANISAILYNSTNGSQLGAITFSTSGADTGDGAFGHLIERMRID